MRLPVPFVFVLGPPGCGKGTQCALLCQEFSSILHLSAGELLRQYIKSDSNEEARRLNKIMSEGQIVPAEVTIGLLQEQLSNTTASVCLIDGFPRNVENYSGWDKIDAQQPQFVLNMTAQQHDIQQRLLNRTGGRSDDTLETIKKRFKVYETMRPVLEAYESQGKLRTVDASPRIQDVYRQVRGIFMKELGHVLENVDKQEMSQVDT